LIGGTDAEQVMITDVVPDQQLFCPGEEVLITCETTNSPTLYWISNEYCNVETGGIMLARFNRPGDEERCPVNPRTVATLISNNITENGEQILVSTLRITTCANFSTASITCLSEDGSMNSTGVQVLGKHTTIIAIWQIGAQKHVIGNYRRCCYQLQFYESFITK
jgi:hypothetical protein